MISIDIVIPFISFNGQLLKSIESIIDDRVETFLYLISPIDISGHQLTQIKNVSSGASVKILKDSGNGLSSALNFAINQGSSKYIARMDADDLSLNNRIFKQINFLEQNKEIDIVGSNIISLNKSTKVATKLKTKSKRILENFILFGHLDIAHPSIMFRRSSFENFGCYDPEYKYAEDFEIFQRWLLRGAVFANIIEPLLEYQISPNQASQNPVNDTYIKKALKKNLSSLVGASLGFSYNYFRDRDFKNIETRFSLLRILIVKNKIYNKYFNMNITGKNLLKNMSNMVFFIALYRHTKLPGFIKLRIILLFIAKILKKGR